MKRYILATALLASFSTQALAWGKFEQGILTGIAGFWVYDKFNQASQPMPVYPAGVQLQRPMQPPAMPHSAPPPTTWFYRYPECRTEYLYNNIGVAVATQSVCN